MFYIKTRQLTIISLTFRRQEVIIILLKIITEDGKMEVTKDSVIGDVLDYDIDTAQFFFEIGMHCLGCPASRGESIEMACAVHGTDPDELVEKINAFLAAKK